MIKNTAHGKITARKTSITLLALISFQMGCSTAKVRILPGEDGVHQAISRDIERDGAEETAVKKANEYCEKQDKDMYIVKEDKTKYDGSMDEETRKNVRNASKAAILLGNAQGELGGIVRGAGMTGHTMTSDRDYEARIKFTCR